MDSVVKIAGSIVALATIAVLIVNAKGTADIISKLFGGFSGAITAAQKG